MTVPKWNSADLVRRTNSTEAFGLFTISLTNL